MDEFTVDHLCGRLPKDVAAQCWALARQFVMGLALTVVCQSALAQAMYRIKPLGFLGGCISSAPQVFGFNGADEVTGNACNAHGDGHAFSWKNDGSPMVDLGPPEVGSFSQATAINASGLVAGYAQDSTGWFAFESFGDGTPMKRIYNGLGGTPTQIIQTSALNDLGQLTGIAYKAGNNNVYHAFLWKNDGSPMVDLGTLGGNASDSYAINAYGQVTGYSSLQGGVNHAFVWKNDGTPMLDLGTLGGYYGGGYAINASGQVAGTSGLSQNQVYPVHAFFWRNDGTPMEDLGTLGGTRSYVLDLNDAGQVAGYSYTGRRHFYHAFVWMNDGTPMKDLGTIGGNLSEALDINSSGQVTGEATLAGDAVFHAFLWRNDGTKVQDLNTLIDPTDPLKPFVTLTSGAYINNFGDIVAHGTDSRTGLQDLYLLQGTVLTLNPRALAFGNQPINTKSAAKSVTMTNTSANVVAINSIALKGVAAGQFASTNNCGASLVGHATCTIKVTFKPTTKGAKSATLNVNGGGGGLRSVALSGVGT